MAEQQVDPATAVRRLVEGFQVSQALHVAATLGIADLLVDGGRSSDELAAATSTHAPTLYRLLRALASVDVLRELDGCRFELTPLGERLRSARMRFATCTAPTSGPIGRASPTRAPSSIAR